MIGGDRVCKYSIPSATSRHIDTFFRNGRSRVLSLRSMRRDPLLQNSLTIHMACMVKEQPYSCRILGCLKHAMTPASPTISSIILFLSNDPPTQNNDNDKCDDDDNNNSNNDHNNDNDDNNNNNNDSNNNNNNNNTNLKIDHLFWHKIIMIINVTKNNWHPCRLLST